jgi:hypothetical protein
MSDTPTPNAALIARVRHELYNGYIASWEDMHALCDALAAAELDATRWRRAVAACLPGQTPETAVECVSHLALADAEQEIAALRAALSALVTLDGAVEALRKVMEQKP